MLIRRATKSDIPGIIEIEKVSFSSPWNEQFFLDAICSDNKYFFVDDENGDIAGYIVFEKVVDEGHITDLAVEGGHRQKGIASGLVRQVFILAGGLGIKEIFLEVRESNEAAKRLYSKFGFEGIGRRKKYYSAANEDALIMHIICNGGERG